MNQASTVLLYWIMLAISLVASLAIFLNILSSLFTEIRPEVSVILNPTNIEARKNFVKKNRKQSTSLDKNKKLLEYVNNGIWFEKYDAGLYSIYGLLTETSSGTPEAAQNIYLHALKLDPADYHSLQRRLEYVAKNGEIETAIKLVETFYRAWPKEISVIAGYLPSLLSDSQGYDRARERFAATPGGARALLLELAKQQGGQEHAVRLLVDWHQTGNFDLRTAINTITRQLIREGRLIQAFLLFGLTLNHDEKEVAGIIYNSDFSLQPNGNWFDWLLPEQSGVGFDIIEQVSDLEIESNDSVTKGAKFLRIQFFDTPLQIFDRLQLVRIPAAKMRWQVEYSSRDAKGPKPLELILRCHGTSREFAKLVLEPTDGKLRKISTSVARPTENCNLQGIWISNGNPAKSWRNRYSGSLDIHKIEIGYGET